jgi:hypothetical protein
MNPEHVQAILDLATGRITEAEFLRRYPVDPRREPDHVRRLLEDASHSRNADDVEYAMLLGFTFGWNEDTVSILNRLLVEDWHQQHENIAMALSELRTPSSVESLYQAALSHHPYLDYDDSYALAVKCIWGLGKIGTEAARERLARLAASENPVIRDQAQKQLKRIRA